MKLSRSAAIERTIKQCALATHPSGELRHLAARMGVHYSAFRRWWTRGRVPHLKAEWLGREFPHIADPAFLSGDCGGAE